MCFINYKLAFIWLFQYAIISNLDGLLSVILMLFQFSILLRLPLFFLFLVLFVWFFLHSNTDLSHFQNVWYLRWPQLATIFMKKLASKDLKTTRKDLRYSSTIWHALASSFPFNSIFWNSWKQTRGGYGFSEDMWMSPSYLIASTSSICNLIWIFRIYAINMRILRQMGGNTLNEQINVKIYRVS